MTKTKLPTPGYVSGWCGSDRHDTCRGIYAGVVCSCEHHTAGGDEPNLLADLMGGLAGVLELFHIDGVPAEPDPLDGLSADARRTARQRLAIERGVHPLNRLKTRPDLGTCGGCRFREVIGWHDRSFPKCAWGPRTHGAATDIRGWWPACPKFQPKEPTS